ncbi:hypothetical protein [Streptococcus ruminantium]|uniref:hypothetical protein n=1 Tax=Streptococcus ruminantium TaxID=1917441 RepID=UPI003F757EE3
MRARTGIASSIIVITLVVVEIGFGFLLRTKAEFMPVFAKDQTRKEIFVTEFVFPIVSWNHSLMPKHFSNRFEIFFRDNRLMRIWKNQPILTRTKMTIPLFVGNFGGTSESYS